MTTDKRLWILKPAKNNQEILHQKYAVEEMDRRSKTCVCFKEATDQDLKAMGWIKSKDIKNVILDSTDLDSIVSNLNKILKEGEI